MLDKIDSLFQEDRGKDSAVGLLTGYGLNGLGIGVRISVGQHFPPFHCQAGSGARRERETEHSPPMGTKVPE
jgi:hypothetical protein